MDEQTYWAIEIVDYTGKGGCTIGSGTVLQYYPNEGGVAEILFTDKERASGYARQAVDTEHTEWRLTPLQEGELAYFIEISVPKKTHVLIDPEYGDEERALQPIIRE
jgi:hypothetical protein